MKQEIEGLKNLEKTYLQRGREFQQEIENYKLKIGNLQIQSPIIEKQDTHDKGISTHDLSFDIFAQSQNVILDLTHRLLSKDEKIEDLYKQISLLQEQIIWCVRVSWFLLGINLHFLTKNLMKQKKKFDF